MNNKYKRKIIIDGKAYQINVIRQVERDQTAPRLIIVCYNFTHVTREITRVCIESIKKYTDEPHELWVVDNNSPKKHIEWLYNQPDINIVLNRTVPSKTNKKHLAERLGLKGKKSSQQMKAGSYANGIGLEIAAQVVDTQTKYMFVMHNDVLVCRSGWLGFLVSKIDDRVRGASVSHDPSRVKAMHASGVLFDFSLFKKLNMNFLPGLPDYDVSDLVTVRLREAGYDYYVCKNTFNHPEMIDTIKSDARLRKMYCDRVFDDEGNVIYIHLGRGTPKSAGKYIKPGKTYPEQWINYADKYLLS